MEVPQKLKIYLPYNLAFLGLYAKKVNSAYQRDIGMPSTNNNSYDTGSALHARKVTNK